MTRAGLAAFVVLAFFALAAPYLEANDVGYSFPDRSYAPPTRIHLADRDGWHAPFIYRQVLVDRLMRTYADDRTTRVPLRWFTDGRLVTVDPSMGPLLLAGGDETGRDVFSRLASGAQRSLGVTLLGALGAILIGAIVGSAAGVAGGLVETALMWVADLMLVLPAAYLLLVVRGRMPVSLPESEIFAVMVAIFAASGWPRIARGVRGIVATEGAKDYAQAARAIGVSWWRLVGHILPAAEGFLTVELVLLVPAMLVGEATLSYLGIGFQPDQPSWGNLLASESNVQVAVESPWLLAPAVMLFLVVLGLQLAVGSRAERVLLTGASRT